MTQPISNTVSSKIDTSVMGTIGIVALVSALAVTLIVLQYSSYNTAFVAQTWPILGCMTLGGPALAVFCITTAIKMREKNPPELLLGIRKERDEAPKLVGLLIDELLKQFPQYKEALNLEEEFEDIRGVVSY